MTPTSCITATLSEAGMSGILFVFAMSFCDRCCEIRITKTGSQAPRARRQAADAQSCSCTRTTATPSRVSASSPKILPLATHPVPDGHGRATRDLHADGHAYLLLLVVQYQVRASEFRNNSPSGIERWSPSIHRSNSCGKSSSLLGATSMHLPGAPRMVATIRRKSASLGTSRTAGFSSVCGDLLDVCRRVHWVPEVERHQPRRGIARIPVSAEDRAGDKRVQWLAWDFARLICVKDNVNSRNVQCECATDICTKTSPCAYSK
jgi:hypothetical protein